MAAKLKKNSLATQIPETTEWQYIAICAMYRGEATPEQQVAGMEWIIKNASHLGDLSIDENVATMSFHEGRRYVGHLIVRMLKEPRETFITVKEKRHA